MIIIGFPGLINRLRDGSDISDITIPVWDVGFIDFQKVINYMQSNNTNITVIVEMDYEGMIFNNFWSDPLNTIWNPFFRSGARDLSRINLENTYPVL